MYSAMNCVAFTLFAMTGAFALVTAFLPPYAISPIILFVGLAINQDTFSVCPARHVPAAIAGLIPAVADYVNSFWPHGATDRFGNVAAFPPNIAAIGYGALLVSLLWTSMMIFVIDRRFKSAALWAFIGAILSSVGLIHQEKMDLGFENFSGAPGAFGVSAHSFLIGYLSACALFAFMAWLQAKRPDRVPPPVEEEAAPSEKARDMAERRQSASFGGVSGSRFGSVIVDDSDRDAPRERRPGSRQQDLELSVKDPELFDFRQAIVS